MIPEQFKKNSLMPPLKEFLYLLEHKISSKTEKPYRNKMIGLRIELNPDNDIIVKLYNSYYFREHLKKSGFIFDGEAWVGYLDSLLSIDKRVLIRLIESISLNSAKKYLKVVRDNMS